MAGEQTAPAGNCAAHSWRPMSFDRYVTLTSLWRVPFNRSWTTLNSQSKTQADRPRDAMQDHPIDTR
jgi:hypothetical protein